MSKREKWNEVAKDAVGHEHHVHAVHDAIASAEQTLQARGLAAWNQIKANGDAMLAAGEPPSALVDGAKHLIKHEAVLIDSIVNGVN